MIQQHPQGEIAGKGMAEQRLPRGVEQKLPRHQRLDLLFDEFKEGGGIARFHHARPGRGKVAPASGGVMFLPGQGNTDDYRISDPGGIRPPAHAAQGFDAGGKTTRGIEQKDRRPATGRRR